jgi:hypothetical protein
MNIGENSYKKGMSHCVYAFKTIRDKNFEMLSVAMRIHRRFFKQLFCVRNCNVQPWVCATKFVLPFLKKEN